MDRPRFYIGSDAAVGVLLLTSIGSDCEASSAEADTYGESEQMAKSVQ